MKAAFFVVILVAVLAFAGSNVQNADGSFSIGTNYQGQGSVGDSLYALLTKSGGWTQNSVDQNQNTEVQVSGSGSTSLLHEIPNLVGTSVRVAKNIPYIEILKLLEAFLTVKGEVVARLYALRNDNMHIINAIMSVLVTKIPLVHRFTLGMVVALRSIFEYAARIFRNVNISIATETSYAQ